MTSHTVPHVDEHWLPGPWGRCRAQLQSKPRQYCRRATVASVLRGRRRPQRWGYCSEHLAGYGRLVREGAVWWDPDAAAASLAAPALTTAWQSFDEVHLDPGPEMLAELERLAGHD